MDERRERPHHHGDLRAALLAAATAHVRREGAAGFSLRHATAEAGVTSGAAYRHFASRAALLDEVVVEGFARLSRAMAAASAGTSGRDRLAATGRAYVAFAAGEPHLFALMFGTEGAAGRARASTTDLGGPNASDQLRAALTDAGIADPSAYDQAWGMAHGLAALAAAGMRLDHEAAMTGFVARLAAARGR